MEAHFKFGYGREYEVRTGGPAGQGVEVEVIEWGGDLAAVIGQSVADGPTQPEAKPARKMLYFSKSQARSIASAMMQAAAEAQ